MTRNAFDSGKNVKKIGKKSTSSKSSRKNRSKKNDDDNSKLFTEVLNSLSGVIDHTVDENDYDAVIVKKMAATNVGAKGHQGHIAITGNQRDMFPSLYSETYLNGLLERSKSFFTLRVPVTIKKDSIGDMSNDERCWVSVTNSCRKNGDIQIEFSKKETDDEKFKSFRDKYVKSGDTLVICKKKGELEYDIFLIKQEKSEIFGKFGDIYFSKGKRVTCINSDIFDFSQKMDFESCFLRFIEALDLEDDTRRQYYSCYEEIEKNFPNSFDLDKGPLENKKQIEVIKESSWFKEYLSRSNENAVGNNSVLAMFADLSSFISFFDLKSEQKILFGAPGTGKSYRIDKEWFFENGTKSFGLEVVSRAFNSVYRTTFYPDYDYSLFLGAYKPCKNEKKQDQVLYDYVPQVFVHAYERAWDEYEKNERMPIPVYLVIEEINRGNCAAIFGDVFQLLDRDKEGFSHYGVDADSDLASYLEKKGKSTTLILPPNLHILATMNTSDQSLFPMDSAFKRRFDWEYVAIDYEKSEADFKVFLDKDGHEYFKWLDFIQAVNADIYTVNNSEDKQLGEFFVKAQDKKVDLDTFCSKVMFYLWDSVYKDEPNYSNVYFFDHPDANHKDKDGLPLKVTFQSLFEKNKSFAKDIIKKMLDKEHLNVMLNPPIPAETAAAVVEDAPTADTAAPEPAEAQEV